MSLLEGSFYVLRCTGPPSTKRVPEIPHAGGMQYWVDKYLLLNWCARQGLGGLESFTVHVVRVEVVRVRGRDFRLGRLGFRGRDRGWVVVLVGKPGWSRSLSPARQSLFYLQ